VEVEGIATPVAARVAALGLVVVADVAWGKVEEVEATPPIS